MEHLWSENQGFLHHSFLKRQNEQCSELHCVNIIEANDLEPTARPQVIAELQLEGVRTGPDPIVVVVEAHVPDGENRGERAFRAVLRQCLLWESCPE